MKALLAVMAFVVASSAQAEGKVWLDEACGFMVEGGPKMTFEVATMDGGYESMCQVVDWPTSSPTATMQCNDGSTAQMQLDGNGVMRIGGLPVITKESLTLYPQGDERVRCD